MLKRKVLRYAQDDSICKVLRYAQDDSILCCEP